MGNVALQSLSDHLLGCGAGFGFNTFALGGVGGLQLHGRVKQLMVFFDAAGTGNGGRWSADAVLRACCKVVCWPKSKERWRVRVVLVHEHRTSRVSSAVNGQQPSWSQQRDQPVRDMMWCPVVAPRKPPQAPCSSQAATQPAASGPGPSTPLPAERSKCTKAEQVVEPTQPTKGQEKGKGKAAKAKRAPQPGRWLIRDCNATLNMQHPSLPAKGKVYPGLGYKRLRDQPPKAQEQQPVVAQ
ncbi:hypothetical protein QJQ45_001943 [Haematococcus lacustris]|nr:hypothetical protein QJQ45_001943 [Haematococcus lacustris]